MLLFAIYVFSGVIKLDQMDNYSVSLKIPGTDPLRRHWVCGITSLWGSMQTPEVL